MVDINNKRYIEFYNKIKKESVKKLLKEKVSFTDSFFIWTSKWFGINLKVKGAND